MKLIHSLSYLLFLILTGCSSIPLASMLKLAAMDNKDLLSIEPRQVRAKITINEPAKLQTKDVRLALRFEYSGEGEREYQFVLSLLDYLEINQAGGWFSEPTKRHQYQFKVSEQSIAAFENYQKDFARLGKPRRYYWTVYYYLAKRPAKEESINLDLELKLSNEEDYFYLLKAAEMNLDS